MMVKTYVMLTKPGIIFGNIVTTAAGFALAARGNIDYRLFFLTLLGLGLVIASAGVFNNYIDRAMDAKMARTKDRPLASGGMPPLNAILFATVLGVAGMQVLYLYTNLLTVCVAAAGFFTYLVLYAFMKYHSFYGTIVGSIAGAVPPVVGYCAVSDNLDTGAVLLFLILVLWQMPHFYAIAIYRFDDYANAAVPVLPVVRGFYVTKIHMALYIVAFIGTALTLTAMGYMGNAYAAIVAILGFTWFGFALLGFKAESDRLWAHRMFIYSLVVIMGLCSAVPFDVR